MYGRRSRSSQPIAHPSGLRELVPPIDGALIGDIWFGDKAAQCKALEHVSFSDTDVCLMSAGGRWRKYSPRIGARGCVVIEQFVGLAPRFRDVPLIVPRSTGPRRRGSARDVIANQLLDRALVVALKPLHDRATIAAGGGDLSVGFRRPARRRWTNCSPRPARVRVRSGRTQEFTERIAFDVMPQIDVSVDNGSRPRRSRRWSPRPRKSSTPRSS